MKKVIILAFILILSYSVIGYAAPAIGLTSVGDLAGISIKATEGQFRPQFIGYLYTSNNSADVNLGVRGLYSLGQVGKVERYTGLGVGYSYSYYKQNPNFDHNHRVSGQLLVGIEFPLGYQSFVTPFDISVEALLQAKTTIGHGFEVGNSVGVGIHYSF